MAAEFRGTAAQALSLVVAETLFIAIVAFISLCVAMAALS